MTQRIALLEAAVSCGSPTRGTEFSYDTLLPYLKELFPDSDCFSMEKSSPCREYPPHLKYLSTVVNTSKVLRQNMLDALRQSLFPIVIGGDHSIAMGSLAALSEWYGAENLALVYIDAHPDFNTESSSDSHYIHGMDLAAACGLCCDELQIGTQRVNILGKNIHIIGARSIDTPEYGIMESQQVNLYTAEDLHRRGANDIIGELLPKLQGKHVHISFDVDFLDPSVFHATGYNLENGGSFHQLLSLLEPLARSNNLVGFECVEYNPTLDKTQKDLKLLNELFSQIKNWLF